MTTITNGTAYLNTGFIQGCTFRPLPALASATKFSQPQPNLSLQQKSAKISAPSGNRFVLTMKSHKSSHTEPSANGWKRKTLYPSAVVSDMRNMLIPQNRLPLPLFYPVNSRTEARIFSNTASSVENAANVMNRKNRLPQILPPVMLSNTVAIVSNSSDGPAPTSRS